MYNVNKSVSLESDKFQTMLKLQNTPHSNFHVSPANTIYGRQLRAGFAFLNKQKKI